MRINTIECIAGTTIRTTWVSSGVAPGAISSALISGSETLISSASAVDSGGGHYYGLIDVPTSGGWYINEWIATINSRPYRNRQLVRSVRLEAE